MEKLRYEYKGKVYLYISIVTLKGEFDSEDVPIERPLVLYRAEDSSRLYTRHEEEFHKLFKRIHG